MEFYYLPYSNHNSLYPNKNNIIFPNQLHNYNSNTSSGVSISSIKSQNLGKIENHFHKKDDFSNNNLIIGNKNYGIDNITNKNNHKNKSEDYENKSVNSNNLKINENIKLKNNYSYTNILLDDKNMRDSKTSSYFFDYSSKKFNEPISNQNKMVFYLNNHNNNKDSFLINSKNSNFETKDKNYSLFENKKENNKEKNNTGKNIYLNNNYILNNENNNQNNKSLSSSKVINNKKYNYLFDYSDNNNLNKDLNNDYSNNFKLHDKYISPDYIDTLKSKIFYSPIKEEKSLLFFKSLNKFESYNNNYTSEDNSQTSNLKNININKNSKINKSFTPNKINNNKNSNKINGNYKDNLLNYILNKSEIIKKIIDNNLSNQNNQKNIKSNLSNNINFNYYLPPKTNEYLNKKTLLLDLDETLVHSSFKPLQEKPDINFTIYFQNKPHIINVLIRPYVQEFLKKMSELYEIVIFTASVPQYANPLLDILDKNKYIYHRLYRQHCISLYGLFIKDLRRIGRDLKNTIILDNNPISYLLNQENGIPIKTWHSDKTDQELIKLIPLFEYLSKKEISDIREIIKKIVVNNSIDFNLVNSIINRNNFTDKREKYLGRANSFSKFEQNSMTENSKFITPKKDKSFLINNYFNNESYNKNDNKNININIINFNIEKVFVKENYQNSNFNSIKKINNMPIYNKNNKSEAGMHKILNNVKNHISKENIESLINTKYKYLTHLINGRKQFKSNKLLNKEIEINNSLRNYKRQLSQKNLLSTSNKNRTNDKKNHSFQKTVNISQTKKYNKKDYNDLINAFQNNKNSKGLYDNKNKDISTVNNINRENNNYLSNNFINIDNIDKNNNKNSNHINQKYNYYSLLNDINSNERNDRQIIFNKIHQRASTPSTNRLFFPSNFSGLNKENSNYDYIRYVYKFD